MTAHISNGEKHLATTILGWLLHWVSPRLTQQKDQINKLSHFARLLALIL